MIETVKDSSQFILDLRVQFFIRKELRLEEVQDKLSFRTIEAVTKVRYFSETMTVDFDSDWAHDKPGFLAPMSEMDGELFWPGSEVVEELFTETMDEFADNEEFTEWLYFSRVLVEIDSEYEWDFSDEPGMENFDEAIKYPFFRSLRLEFKDLQVARYHLDLRETY